MADFETLDSPTLISRKILEKIRENMRAPKCQCAFLNVRQNFSVTQILREIKVSESRDSKSAI